MSSLQALGLALGVCTFIASAQNTQPEPPPMFQAGLNYAYNAFAAGPAQANQSGASISGEYFFKWVRPRWGGRDE